MAERVERLKRELKYQGTILKIYEDTVIANGHEAHWDFIHHDGAAAVLPVTDDGKILMVRQYRNALDRETLEIPAGKLDDPKEPKIQCAYRELEEETGYRANKWTALGYIYTSPGYSDEKLYLYRAEDLEFVGEHPDEGEIIKAFEYPVSEIKEKIKNGEINDAKTICAVMRGLYD